MYSTRLNLVMDSKGATFNVPKNLMDISGLQDEIQIVAKKGKIILTSIQKNREGWDIKIASVIANDPNVLNTDPELDDWHRINL